MMRFLIPFTALLLSQACGFLPKKVQDIQQATWVTRWDFRTEADVRNIVRNCAEAGFDTVFFQVRGNATAFYSSRIEPWAEEFEFRNPGFDPLRVACDEARRRGITIHAWVNALPAWRGGKAPRIRNHIFHTRPEWFLYDRQGNRQPLQEKGYVALNPCLPEVRSYLGNIYREIAANYPVNGIHIDFIRFLEREGEGAAYPFDGRTLELFARETGLTPDEDPEAWKDWKTGKVTELVELIRLFVRQARRGCVVTAAVFPLEQADAYHQDWPDWIAKGYVDGVFPMLYTDDDARFERQVRDAVEAVGTGNVIPAIGVYKHLTPEQTLQQIAIAEGLGCKGFGLFGYHAFYSSAKTDEGLEKAYPKIRLRRRNSLIPTLNRKRFSGY